jgi:vacuolar-type H+-ATPase subunit I/STV1
MAQQYKAQPRANELIQQMQDMSQKIADLITQVQQADKTLKLYSAESNEAAQVRQARDTLIGKIEVALDAQSQIPLKMLNLSISADEGKLERLSERINRLTNNLDDIAASYDEVRNYSQQISDFDG